MVPEGHWKFRGGGGFKGRNFGLIGSSFSGGWRNTKKLKATHDWSQARSNNYVGCFDLPKLSNYVDRNAKFCDVDFGRPDLHIRVYGKLLVSLAFCKYCTVFNPFNGNVFVKHQSCLNKYKNIIVQSSKGFSAAFHWISSR